jgi:phage shock protein E
VHGDSCIFASELIVHGSFLKFNSRDTKLKKKQMLREVLKNLFGGNKREELEQALNTNPYLIDVRSPGEFASGSVKGAQNFPLGELQRFAAKLDKKKSVVVFCRSGNRSAQGVAILKAMGFEQVINGGSWQNVKNHI